jgi:hypothetical protein
MEHGLQIWDCRFDEDNFVFSLERYVSDHEINGSFEAKKCPEGHRPVGGGITFIRHFDQLRREPTEVIAAAEVGDKEYRRTNQRHKGRLLVFVILPEEHAISNIEGVKPKPVTFRIHKSRMAFYWDVTPESREFYWKIEKANKESLAKRCRMLNRALLEFGTSRPADSATDIDVPANAAQVALHSDPSKDLQPLEQLYRQMRKAVHELLRQYPEGCTARFICSAQPIRRIREYSSPSRINQLLRKWPEFETRGYGRKSRWVLKADEDRRGTQ